MKSMEIPTKEQLKAIWKTQIHEKIGEGVTRLISKTHTFVLEETENDIWMPSYLGRSGLDRFILAQKWSKITSRDKFGWGGEFYFGGKELGGNPYEIEVDYVNLRSRNGIHWRRAGRDGAVLLCDELATIFHVRNVKLPEKLKEGFSKHGFIDYGED